MQSASILRRYLTLFFQQEGRRAALAFVGMSFSGLLSGVSILAILPLLHLLGVDGSRGGVGDYGTRATSESFSGIHALMTETPLADSLGLMLTAFVAFCTVQALLLRSINLLNADVERSFTRTLEKRLYAAIMQCDWMFFLRNRNSDLTFALTQNVQRVSSGTISFLRLISSAMIAIVHVSLCLVISPLISVGLLSCFGGFTLAVQRYNRGIKHRGTEMVGLKKKMYGTVTDYLAGMKEARSACSEQQQIESFSETSDAVRTSYLKFLRIQENTSLASKLGSVVMISLVLYLSIEVVQVPMVEMLLLVAIAGRLLPRLRNMQTSWQQIAHMLPAFASLTDLLHRCEEARESQENGTPQTRELHREIRFENVGFDYQADEHDTSDISDSDNQDTDRHNALANVDFRIAAGSTVAFVGASGAGKTTLVDMLMGLLRPTTGQILVDDAPLSRDEIRAWRSNIGYVPQETFLLHDTLRANLQWCNPDATEDELWAALRLASAEGFVSNLSDGLETVVGDRGVRLSGGERQRIALARALVRRPKLLILDEATSSLDGENQRRIQAAIQQLHGEMTIVIVAHRLSAVRHADQIVVMQNGQIVESGSYEELIAQGRGQFADLVQAEAGLAA